MKFWHFVLLGLVALLTTAKARPDHHEGHNADDGHTHGPAKPEPELTTEKEPTAEPTPEPEPRVETTTEPDPSAEPTPEPSPNDNNGSMLTAASYLPFILSLVVAATWIQ